MINTELNEKAGWILGWKPGQKCPQGNNRYPTNVNVDDETGRHTYCVDCHFDYTAHEYKKFGEHDVPAPDFNDWRVVGAALEKLVGLREHMIILCDDGCTLETKWELVGEHDISAPDLKTTIALACAKLGEQR